MKTTHLIRKALHYLNIESELEDHQFIHQEIVKGVVFKGTNLWILFFAIIVASVGLNMNSTAVIIGAMLISPLMGPINGMGYSIATYNFELFRLSLRNFSFAVGVSLVASTAYFALSPISTAHSELLARTSPTIYDVLIALFGGLAGIVAISSRQKGNVIPGVAIATALMPPLCTAGYGLATAQMDFFFGAFYLFTINTVFIALASVAISQVLKFPIITLVDPVQKKKVDRWISVVILGVMLPSIYFGYGLVKNERFSENANRYISNVSTFEGNYLLKSSVDVKNRIISLTYAGINLSEHQKALIEEKAKDFNLPSAQVVISQGLAIDSEGSNNVETIKLKNELVSLQKELANKEILLDSIVIKKLLGKSLLSEINSFFPQIKGCSYAETVVFNTSKQKPVETALVLFAATRHHLTTADKQKIDQWVKSRLKTKSVMVVFDESEN